MPCSSRLKNGARSAVAHQAPAQPGRREDQAGADDGQARQRRHRDRQLEQPVAAAAIRRGRRRPIRVRAARAARAGCRGTLPDGRPVTRIAAHHHRLGAVVAGRRKHRRVVAVAARAQQRRSRRRRCRSRARETRRGAAPAQAPITACARSISSAIAGGARRAKS